MSEGAKRACAGYRDGAGKPIKLVSGAVEVDDLGVDT
jgi:hypothetical protein